MSQAQAAGLRRAQIAASKETLSLDREMMEQLLLLYKAGLADLTERFGVLADGTGHVRIDMLSQLIQEIEQVLLAVQGSQQTLLITAINNSAVIGASVVDAGITSNAVTSVWQTTQSDGLNLSQRVWRLNEQNKRLLINEIQASIVRGDSAFKAARDFLNNGMSVPGSITAEAGLSTASNLGNVSAESILKEKESALYKLQRLFRTEMARAHSQAYMDSVDGIDGVIGYKFNLSSAHKKTDICDLHAKANLYGLGRGVYPKSVISRIYPAHPQTTSFVTAVWEDEVTEQDKVKDVNRVEWLKKQSIAMQEGVLGKQKAKWLRQGLLTDRNINTKVSVLKKKFGE